jgi:hypothetical protein
MTAPPFDDVRLGECNACGKTDVAMVKVDRDLDRWRCLDCYIDLTDDVALCSVDRLKLAREREAEARRGQPGGGSGSSIPSERP